MISLEWDRRAAIEAVREDVWRYLTAAARDDDAVALVAAALLDMPPDDVRRIACVHFLLSDEVGELLRALPQLSQRLTITTDAVEERDGAEVRGPILWGRTYELRASTGARRGHVTTRPQRVFDTPENRVLAFALDVIIARAGDLSWLGRGRGRQADRVARRAKAARRWRQSPWLATMPLSASTGRRDLMRVRTSLHRSRYAPALAVAELHERYLDKPDVAAVCAAVERRGLVASADATLFELRCLFQTLGHLRAAGWRTDAVGLVGGALVHRAVRDEEALELRLRGGPAAFTAGSSYVAELDAHGFTNLSGLKPDLVVGHRGPRGERWIVVEAKMRRRVGEAARAALGDLCSYRAAFVGALGRDEGIVGIGYAWGAELDPVAAGRFALCTPDTYGRALELAGIA